MTDGDVGDGVHVTLNLSDALGARELEVVVLVAGLVMDQEEVIVAVSPVNPEGRSGRVREY